MWAGRSSQGVDSRVNAFNSSIAFDETSSDAVVKVDGAPAYFHWFEN